MCKSTVVGSVSDWIYELKGAVATNRKKKEKNELNSGPRPAPKQRNHCLDAIRGLAIVLMIVDHAADLLFEIGIQPMSIRMPTRLSMPLFSILMGYFLAGSKQVNWNRFFQLMAATAIVNIAYFSIRSQVEILASLLVCYCLFLALRSFFVLLLPVAFFFVLDPSTNYFDFSLSVVVGCVAQGMVLRQFGVRAAVSTAMVLLVATMVVSPPTQYVLYFVLPATLMIAWGISQPNRSVPLLSTTGRFPLTIYVAQYYVLIALSF